MGSDLLLYYTITVACIAFDITRCYYLNTLTALGAPELTASFCASADVMAEHFPPAIRFGRPRTLGSGDAVCDFQYCRESVLPGDTSGQI